MTDSDIDVDAPDDEPSMTHDEATEVVENDPALQEAGADSEPDSAGEPA